MKLEFTNLNYAPVVPINCENRKVIGKNGTQQVW